MQAKVAALFETGTAQVGLCTRMRIMHLDIKNYKAIAGNHEIVCYCSCL